MSKTFGRGWILVMFALILGPVSARAATSGDLDFRSVDVESWKQYNQAFEFDKSNATAEEKAQAWRRLAKEVPKFAKSAEKRAAAWDRYAALLKEGRDAKERLLRTRDNDWAKLEQLLPLHVIPESDKARWSAQFVRTYWKAPGIEPVMAKALAPHMPRGPMQRALQALGRRAPLVAYVPAAAAAAPAAPKAGPANRATPGDAGIDWVQIPGGKFTMGSSNGDEAPAHTVSVKSFQMARFLVTNKQYRACVYAGACTAPDSSGDTFSGDDQPVVGVDWNQAKAFSEWVGGRLPSEAQWEYAARSAGKNERYPWGDSVATCDRAVIDQGGNGCGRGSTWPVCSKAAGNTAQGLCDMAGNAWEWVQDWYHDRYEGAPTDGSAWEFPASSNRVFRGGSWYRDGTLARSSHRDYDVPGVRRAGISFRPVR